MISGQLDIGAALRDEGQQRAERSSGTWSEAASEAIVLLAERGQPFTANDVRDLVGDPPVPNSMGTAITNAHRAGLIRFLRYERSARTKRHAARIGVYVGSRA